MYKKWSEKYRGILDLYGDNITGIRDLLGGGKPSILFGILARLIYPYLDTNPDKTILRGKISWRRRINPLIKKIGWLLLPEKVIIEDRNRLMAGKGETYLKDKGVTLPKEPIIYVSNHGFMNDAMLGVLLSRGHTYLVTNALPDMCNSIYGLLSWSNGMILSNHYVRKIKQAIIPKAVSVLRHGADVLIFPEGVWNKTPSLPVLDLWPGFYRIACASGAKVVPIIHYVEKINSPGKGNTVHTVIDDPIQIDHMEETEALQLVRDRFATWTYLMMEFYGKTDRKTLIGDEISSTKAWERDIKARLATYIRYDRQMETTSDYLPKDKALPTNVWRPIANIKHPNKNNVLFVLSAKRILKEAEENDFQHTV